MILVKVRFCINKKKETSLITLIILCVALEIALTRVTRIFEGVVMI